MTTYRYSGENLLFWMLLLFTVVSSDRGDVVVCGGGFLCMEDPGFRQGPTNGAQNFICKQILAATVCHPVFGVFYF